MALVFWVDPAELKFEGNEKHDDCSGYSSIVGLIRFSDNGSIIVVALYLKREVWFKWIKQHLKT